MLGKELDGCITIAHFFPFFYNLIQALTFFKFKDFNFLVFSKDLNLVFDGFNWYEYLYLNTVFQKQLITFFYKFFYLSYMYLKF